MVCCLMFNGKHFMQIQDVNNLNNIIKLYRNWRGMGQRWQWLPLEKYGEVASLCNGYNEPILFWNLQKKSLIYRESGTLKTGLTHNGP